MYTIKESTLNKQIVELFKDDEEAGNIFSSMVTCCHMKFFPPTISPSMFDRIVKVVGERFEFLSKEDERLGRYTTSMMLCRMYYQGDTAETATKHRIYMVPISDLLFYRQLEPAGILDA